MVSRWVSERRGRIAIAMVLIVWIYFLVAFGEQAWRADQLRADVNEQRRDIERIRDENVELEQQLQRLDGVGYETYVAGVARRDFGLAEPDQTVVVVRWIGEQPGSTPDDEVASDRRDDRPNWERWLDLLTGSE